MPAPIDPAVVSDPVDAFLRMAEQTPFGARGASGLAGLLLLVAGGRLYRLAVITPGVVAGFMLASALPGSVDAVVRVVATVVLGVLGGLLFHLGERLAVHAVGAILLAWLTWVAWSQVAPGAVPWWGPAAGALGGLLLFPRLFKIMVRWVTALLGALVIAWAVGHPRNAWVVGALFLVGVVVQSLGGGGKARASTE